MKHVHKVTKCTPAKADLLPEGHPDLLSSVKGFIANPMSTVEQHLQKSAS